MKKWLLTTAALISLSPLYGYFYLEDIMSEVEQQKTGVYDLNHNKRQELESWLNNTFVLVSECSAIKPIDMPPKNAEGVPETLTFDLIISNGRFVKLSDGSCYEIAPVDAPLTAVWLIPFPITIAKSDDPDFPSLLINQNTNAAVKAKKIDAIPGLPGSQTNS